MKYFWVKIEDKYDWYEYLVFCDKKSEVEEILKNTHEEDFEILDIQANDKIVSGAAIQTRQGCD